MANEITFTTGLVAKKGAVKFERSKSGNADWTTARGQFEIFTIGTTAETISLGADVAAPRWIRVENLDATDDITLGPDSAGTLINFVTLKPGESAVLPLATGVTLKAIASANTPDLEVLVIDT